MARTINDAVTEICSLRHGIENAAWEEARGKLMAYLRLKGSCCGGDQEEYDALNNVIKKFIERIDEDDIYSPDPDEIVRLRGEVERLTLERDYWARARNEWEKSARLLEEENKRLTRELAYMTVQRDQWRSTCASHASRAEAAKKARDMATSALRFYANAEVYKPDAIGRVGDLTFAARDALASIARIAAATGETNE